jgi:hypothetical protein
MRWMLLCAAVAACGGSRGATAVRRWYVVQNGSTFAGAPSPTPGLDVSQADHTVVISRGGSPNSATEGIGLDEGNGAYDVAFFRRVPQRPPTYPMRDRGEDAMLFVVRKDGHGAIVRPNRSWAPLRTIDRGAVLELVGPGDTQTFVHLDDAVHASVTGQLPAVRAVYARFGDVTVVAASSWGESTDLSVGRYDFLHGRGENAGIDGRGVETFVLQSTTATE